MAIKNRGTGFYRDGSFGSCLADPVKSINIVSDADYDDAHLAGTSLNDIIYIVFRSATEFIESNYTDERYDTKKHPYDLHFIEPLDQFLEKKRNLADGFFEFIFHHLPTKALTHNFTIYYDDTAGRHFEIPVKIEQNFNIDETTGLRTDKTVVPTGVKSKKLDPEKLRLVEYYDVENKEMLVFLTNNFEVSAMEVAYLYKNRCKLRCFSNGLNRI